MRGKQGSKKKGMKERRNEGRKETKKEEGCGEEIGHTSRGMGLLEQ